MYTNKNMHEIHSYKQKTQDFAARFIKAPVGDPHFSHLHDKK
jgi:hypothetical protein